MTDRDLSDYAATNGWTVSEEFLPEAEWTFGMPTWMLTVSKDGELFAESTRFGMGEHHYDKLLEAMVEWDGMSEVERDEQRTQARQVRDA